MKPDIKITKNFHWGEKKCMSHLEKLWLPHVTSNKFKKKTYEEYPYK